MVDEDSKQIEQDTTLTSVFGHVDETVAITSWMHVHATSSLVNINYNLSWVQEDRTLPDRALIRKFISLIQQRNKILIFFINLNTPKKLNALLYTSFV